MCSYTRTSDICIFYSLVQLLSTLYSYMDPDETKKIIKEIYNENIKAMY